MEARALSACGSRRHHSSLQTSSSSGRLQIWWGKAEGRSNGIFLARVSGVGDMVVVSDSGGDDDCARRDTTWGM